VSPTHVHLNHIQKIHPPKSSLKGGYKESLWPNYCLYQG